jgi:hypothetical protein
MHTCQEGEGILIDDMVEHEVTVIVTGDDI